MEIIGPERFSEDAEERLEWFRNAWAGKFSTRWPFFAASARTTLGSATLAARSLYTLWREGKDGDAPGEVYYSLVIHYQAVSGGVFASIIATSVAIEALVKLVGSIAYDPDGSIEELTRDLTREKDEGQARSQDELEEVARELIEKDKALRDFDRQSFAQRIATAVRAIGAPDLPPSLQEELEALIRFRNESVHDSPIRVDRALRQTHRPRGHPKAFDAKSRYGVDWDALYSGTFSLRLTHGVRVARIHDEFMGHLWDHGREQITGKMREKPVPILAPRVPWSWGLSRGEIEAMAGSWEDEVVPWLKALDLKELDASYRDLMRPSQVRGME